MNTNRPQQQLVERAQDYIRRYSCTESLSVDSLAQWCGTSRRVLERLFRATINRSPHEAIIRRRIQVAKQALIRTNCPITEIAEAIGFADVKSLRQHFLKLEGMPPGKWRALNRPQIPVLAQSR